jgi:hypothetical protein
VVSRKPQGRLARWGRRLAQDLSGRSGDRLIELLADQLACTTRGAGLTERLASGEVAIGTAHERMRRIEHDGDQARARLVSELSRVLASPVDAEDLFRVSRCVDDVLDNLRDFVREVDLYDPADPSFARPLTEALQQGLEELQTAVAQLHGPAGRPRSGTLATQKAAGQMRRHYQYQLADLFDKPLDADTLKQQELLRRLDIVGIRLAEAAAALADGALKRNL